MGGGQQCGGGRVEGPGPQAGVLHTTCPSRLGLKSRPDHLPGHVSTLAASCPSAVWPSSLPAQGSGEAAGEPGGGRRVFLEGEDERGSLWSRVTQPHHQWIGRVHVPPCPGLCPGKGQTGSPPTVPLHPCRTGAEAGQPGSGSGLWKRPGPGQRRGLPDTHLCIQESRWSKVTS